MSATDARADDAGGASQAAPRIGFRPHPQLPWLLAAPGVPLQVLIEAAPVRVPNTPVWFRGVVSQRGNLLPVFDLARWAGLDDSGMERPQIVSVGQGPQACAVVCGIAPSLIAIIGETDRVETEGALSPFLGPAYATSQGMAREFDMARWLATAASNLTGGAAT
jgi:hypothetical protein